MNRMKRGWIKFLSLIFLGIILVSACSRDVYTQQLSYEVDLRNYRTYAWLPSGDTSWNDFSKDRTVSEEIRKQIDIELQGIGYTLNVEDPDFLVLVHTSIEENTELQTAPSGYYYYGPGFYVGPWYDFYYPYYDTYNYIYGPDVEVIDYSEGMIVVDIIDTQTKKIVWRGTGTETEFGDDIDEEMANKVDEIFEEFPVAEI